MRSIEEQISEIRRRSSLYREKKELRLLSLAATGVGALLLMVMILAPGVKGTMGFGVSHLGATILEPEAGGYVIVALLSFTLGVIITLITQKYRKTGKALKKTAPLFFITFLSSLFLISGSAYAGEETVYNITEGSITVSAYSADGSRHKIKQGENEEETVEGILVIAGNETKTQNTILVNAGEGQKADIVIRGVYIDVRKADDKASLLTEGAGDVDIELDGKNTLIALLNYAGLQKENTGTLIIKDENWEEGSLEAIGGKRGAGIGGGNGGSGENITITGGTVISKVKGGGAGIGGGDNGAGNNITITGGTVTATGISGGAGIGGGYAGSGSNITITGGTVTATGRSGGAGIGGGETASGNNITITGGTVTVTADDNGAGIGGGYKGAGNNITISGGTVISKEVGGGAGIGGGQTASGNNITISGGYVTATGGADITVSENVPIVSNRGAAIGNGYEEASEDNNIVISGWARVTASCYNKTNIKTINCYNLSKYDFSVMYNTGSITTYYLSPTIDGSIQGRTPISQRDGQGTPSATKVRFRSVPEGVVSNFPSDSDDLYKAGSTISMNALEYDSKKYRLLGLSISSGTGILTGDQTEGYKLVVGEAEEGRDSIVVTARFATLSSSADPVKEDTPITKYFVTVNNGTGGGEYEAGETVMIKTDDPPEGKVFDKWTSEDGVTFADPASPETTFIMPSNAVTVTATYKDKEKKEEEENKEEEKKEEQKEEDKPDNRESERKPVDKVPPTGNESYASPADNFAPVANGNKINKMTLDFSRVKESDVDPSELKMTVIKGSKLTTAAKIAEGSNVEKSGGVKVKVNKQGNATITCKSAGWTKLPMEDGATYTVNFTVDKPKAQKLTIPVGKKPVIKTIKDLFGTDIDSGTLTVTSKKNASGAEVSGDNTLVIIPAAKDTIKVQYQYLNKKYKLSIKVK